MRAAHAYQQATDWHRRRPDRPGSDTSGHGLSQWKEPPCLSIDAVSSRRPPARWPTSSFDLLAQAKIDSSKSIKVANLLDKTGVLNNYCLKQIKAVAMAADEINAAGLLAQGGNHLL